MTDLPRLEALLAAATDGPWRVHGPGEDGTVYIDADHEGERPVAMLMSGSPHSQDIKDAALIVELRNQAPALLAAVRGQWQGIDSAPRDGTVFIARNADHPSFGSWPMLRRVRHVVENGEFRCIDLGGWLDVLDIEPDYQEGADTPEQVAVPFWIAPDDLNTSVRYEWQPLPPSTPEPGK